MGVSSVSVKVAQGCAAGQRDRSPSVGSRGAVPVQGLGSLPEARAFVHNKDNAATAWKNVAVTKWCYIFILNFAQL